MSESRVFALRPFPRRLARSLVTFAAVGTLMAGVVWQDGMGRPWVPAVILIGCWAIPALFALQIARGGFDPLQRVVTTELGFEAHYRDGASRFVPWEGVTRLVAVEAFRNRMWAILSEAGPVRWFGEMEDADAFERLAAERTGKTWEHEASLPLEAR